MPRFEQVAVGGREQIFDRVKRFDSFTEGAKRCTALGGFGT